MREERPFRLTYLCCELRHRWGQALCTALGLAAGVALVIVVGATSAGVRSAEQSVLSGLSHGTTPGIAAGAVAGAEATTSGLATDLGVWVAVAALGASFALAILLTLSAVGRRVREFGTLKALGWRARQITAQVVAETAAVGFAGTLAGVALGYAGTALLIALAPTLTITEIPNPSSPNADPRTVAVHLSAPISPGIVVLAVGLGMLGALLAGAVGAWRAAGLRPATALTRTR